MNASIIQIPPKNIADYVRVSTSGTPEQFTESLNLLLQQEVLHICTDIIPIEWATQAMQGANVSRYQLMMQQVPDNFGRLGTAHAIFFLERRQTGEGSN
jgi:hypothetical protein